MVEKNTASARNKRRYAVYAQYRDALGVTDYYISKECGFTQSTLSDWSRGRFCPSADTLLKISRVLGVSIEDFLVD